MLKRLLRRPFVQGCLAALVSRYLAFALATTRWTLHGAEHLAPFAAGQPGVVAFWHERLPLMAALWLRAQADTSSGRNAPLRANVLVSRHRDGRFIGQLMERFGVTVVHGSTWRAGRDRGGAAGIRALLAGLAEGFHVVITPDGPRGPRRVAAPGVAQLAGMAGVPVLPASAQLRRRIELRSWDRMVLPLPWGRGVLVCGPAILVPREGWEAALPVIAAALTQAVETADRLCV